VNDDETTDVRYFKLDELPEMRPDHRRNIEQALRDDPAAVFVRRDPSSPKQKGSD